VIVLCVHDIVPDCPEMPWEVNETDLERVIVAFQERGYTFVGPSQVLQGSQTSVLLTIDDGTAGAANWLIRRADGFDVSAIYFVVVDWLDRPPPRSPEHAYRGLSSWQDVARLRDIGHTLGSHSMSHVRLASQPGDRVWHELSESRERLAAATDCTVEHFAAPFGSISPTLLTMASEAGYATVSSTVPGPNNPEDIQAGLLKRYVIRSDQPRLGLPPWPENVL
jgi:peptidoglycan/xylan/chitin deacetylase (PgdA/CDA1 family)